MVSFDDCLKFIETIGLSPKSIVPLIILSLIVYIIFSTKFNKIFKKINKISKKFDEALIPIRHSIIEIQGILSNAGCSIRYLLTETRKSPLRPTEYGLELFEKSGLKKIFECNKEKFLKELNEKLKNKIPFTTYDVQEKALKLMVDYKDKEMMNPVKSYAYKEGIEVEAILRVSGLFLRDEFLKVNK